MMSFLFEFKQYMAGPIKIPRSSKSLMKDLVFLYAYLFPCKIITNIKEDVINNKDFPSLVEHKTSFFPKDRCMYKNKICPKALIEFFKSIIYDEMV